MKCAVIGGSRLDDNLDPEEAASYGAFGAWLAQENITLLTGGCTGYPHLVAMGCVGEGGESVAYSPADNLVDDREVYGHPAEGFTQHIFLDSGHEGELARLLMRSIPLVDDADVAVSIQGNWGTLMEQCTAVVCDKPLIVVEPSGGASQLFRQIYPTLQGQNRNGYGSKVFYAEDMEQAKDLILQLRRGGSFAC